MVKLAYLISAYQDPIQLGRLLGALDPEATAFIHVDNRVDIHPFEAAAKADIETVFLTNRVDVRWGGFNQVRYQFRMLEYALKHSPDFSHFFFMTGADYPLCSIENMKANFEDNDAEYVTGLNITKLNDAEINWRVRLRHVRDFPRMPRKLQRPLTWAIRNLSRLRLPPNHLLIEGETVDIFMASGYMCISRSLAEYLYKNLSAGSVIPKALRWSFVPEEFVLPTMIFNSPFAPKCKQITQNHGLLGVSRTHYFHYGDGIKILTQEDLTSALASGRLFARKFQTGISDALMDELDSLRALDQS